MPRKFSVIYFLFLYLSLFAQDDVKVISSSSSSILLEYNNPVVDTSIQQSDNTGFIVVNIPNGFLPDFDGTSKPQVPGRIIPLGVPSEFGNTITVLDGQYELLNGRIIPMPQIHLKDGLEEYSYKTDDNYLKYKSPELVTFGGFGLMRDLSVQKIIVNPVQFDPKTNTIKVYKKIRFRINFSGPVNQTYTLKDKLDDTIINFDVAKNWGVKKKSNRLRKAENSVLSTGTWYRFEAPEEGIYKIDRSLLSSMGINPDNVDPRTIKIYNDGGHQLPEKVTAERPVDLQENAILIAGENDGSFDQNDYILFYGRGTDFFGFDDKTKDIVRYKHEFSKHNYYYITSGGSEGKRMPEKASLNEPNVHQQTESRAFLSHEVDEINLGKTGRDYWGEEFNSSTSSHTFINTLNSHVPGSTIKYNYRLANTINIGYWDNLTLRVEENGNVIANELMYGWANAVYIDYKRARDLIGSATFSGNLPDNRSALKFALYNPPSNARAHLDYFTIEYRRYLKAVDDEFIFYCEEGYNLIEDSLYNFSNSNINVFDISDYKNVKKVLPSMLSGGNFIFQSAENDSVPSKYIALCSTKFKTPANLEAVENSNIRGFQTGVKYIVITDPVFTDQAERLVNYRVNQAPHPVSGKVFYTDDIYNEFSCGSLDPTALRDFISYAYQNWDVKPELVLLFGDGDYDYFNTEEKSMNFVPTMQSKYSLDILYSYTYDDYYSWISGDDSVPDVGVGRLNINTSDEAKITVDKIIQYETESEKGLWRNLVTLIADDGPTREGDDGSRHTGQSESLANTRVPDSFDQKKIYLAAYPTVITGAGRRKPAVNQAIIDAINNGTLVLNFIGHGNPDLWTHENVFSKDVSIPQLNNDKLFFLSAATCDFGRYDVPDDPSATELMLLKENGGIIAGFTAARAVFSDANAALNRNLFLYLFDKDNDGLPQRIGYSYMKAKVISNDATNDRKFHLFADPAVRLNMPTLPAYIDSVNGSNLNANVQISALGHVKISGSVLNKDGSPSDFTGEAIISVFDSQKRLYLEEMNYTITLPGGVIFRGRVSVNNGKFNAGFTVPKDISYENKNGKIVSYIFNNQTDGVGYTGNVIVGGTNPSAGNDGNGPGIDIYFDDLSFENSYLVNSNFNLLVKLEDETGINTTGAGVGHKLEGIIDGDEENAIDFTSYFIGDLDAGGKSGIINYRFTDFKEGDHKVEINAWDVFNNVSKEQTYFTVVNSDDLVIREVVNYPNPFASNTTFTFQQNLNKPLNVRIKIYTIAGRLIKELESYNVLEKFVRVPWDGRDADGSVIANGTYLYKVLVESTDGEYKETVLGKLAVIR